jgi:hypothetical protein
MALRMRRIACLDHADHPLRLDVAIVNEVLARLDRFNRRMPLHAAVGRVSIKKFVW